MHAHASRTRRRWRSRLTATLVTLALAAGGALVGAAPAQSLTGRTLVTRTSVADSSPKNVTATCPDGKKVVGAGGEITNSIGSPGGDGRVFVTDVIPDQALTSVTVTGGENSAWSYDWKVKAYAMCAPAASVGNLQRVTETAVTNGTSDALKTATAQCPPGLRLYGTGFEINDANGAVAVERLVPDSGLTEVEGWARENGVFAGTWSWTTYGICGDPGATMILQTALSAYDSNTTHGVTTNPCPSGTTLTGLGAHSWGSVGWVLIDRLSLDLTLNQATVNGWEDQPGGLGVSWSEIGYGICVS